jgi:membrane protein DedA with SNARE-associated domain
MCLPGPGSPKRRGIENNVHDAIAQLLDLVRDSAREHPLWCFPIAAFIAFTESFLGLSFLPCTILLITLGGVIGASHIALWPAVTGAVIGSVIGDWICWWIGKHYHQQIVHVWPFRKFEAEIEKGLQFFHRWGILGIFIGRFLGPFRATVPLVAGMSELNFWTFTIANTASAVIWAYVLLAFPALATRYLVI